MVKKILIVSILTHSLLNFSFADNFYFKEAEKSSMRFIDNQGQWRKNIEFNAKLIFGDIFFEKDNFTFILLENPSDDHSAEHEENDLINGHHFKIRFLNASTEKVISKGAPSSHYYNYFLGNDPKYWVQNVKEFESIDYKNLYPGIDMNVVGKGTSMKYEYYVSPHSDPNQIQVQYEGIDVLTVKYGALRYATNITEIVEAKPYAYQIINGEKIEVNCNYVIDHTSKVVSFEFPNAYDPNYELVIDPILIFSSYTGSTISNLGFTATYDNDGNLYAGGIVFGTNAGLTGYPTINAFQATSSGSISTGYNNGYSSDMGISKFSSDGSTLLFSTYLGGSHNDQPHSMIVNNNNELIIYGRSYSSDYPTSSNAYDQTQNGEADIVITKFSAQGNTLLGSTFIGGSASDGVNFSASPFTYGHTKINYSDDGRGEVVINNIGEIFVGSSTQSSDLFPNGGSLQNSLNGVQDACIFKFNSDLSSLIWGTYFGGSLYDAANSLKVASNNEVYVTGGTESTDLVNVNGIHNTYGGGTLDGFVTRISADGTNIINNSYIGTNNYDQSFFIELDNQENVYLFGQTQGNYPMTAGKYGQANSSQFIHKLTNDLSTTFWSTTFGTGTTNVLNIVPSAFLVDNCGKIYISGWGGNSNTNTNIISNTYNLEVDVNSLQSTTDGKDFYFLVLESEATAKNYSTYFGGTGVSGEHVDGGTSRFDKKGIIYQAVCATCGYNNNPFPTTPGVWAENDLSGSGCNLGAIKMEVGTAPQIIDINADVISGCAPLTVNFESNVSNVNTFYWDFNNGHQSSIQNPTETFINPGTYRVAFTANNSAMCYDVDTNFVTITVTESNSSLNLENYLTTSCSDYSVYGAIPNSINKTFIWNMGDGSSYTSDSIYHTYQNSGAYTITVIITDSTSCSINDTLNYTVNFTNSGTNIVSASTTIGCPPLSVDFTNSNTNLTVYNWSISDGSTYNSANISHRFVNPGNYEAVLISQNACNILDTTTIQVTVIDNELENEIIVDTLYYQCDSLVVDVSASYTGNAFYSWDFGNGFHSNAPSETITYGSGIYNINLNLSPQNNPCNTSIENNFMINVPNYTSTLNDTIFIESCVPHEVNFAYYTTDSIQQIIYGDSSVPSNNPIHTYNNVGTYIAKIIQSNTTGFCTASPFQIVVIDINELPQQPSVDIQVDTFACDSMIVHLSAVTGQGNFYWTINNSDSIFNQNYTYTITEFGNYNIEFNFIAEEQSCGENYQQSQNIIFQKVEAILTASDSVICTPAEVSFNNLSQNAITYYWSDGRNISGTSVNLPTVSYYYEGSHSFNLVAANLNSCNLSDTAIVNIQANNQRVQANFNFNIINSCDSLLSINLDNQSINATTYMWSFGDSTSNIKDILNYEYTTIGKHTITLMAHNPNLCVPRDTISFDFELLPNVEAKFTTENICIGQNIKTNNFSTAGADIIWDYGNNSTSTEWAPIHEYNNSGEYNIILRAIDSNSCNFIDTSIQTIKVFETPISNFETDLSQFFYKEAVNFNNLSSNYNSFTWNFGDGISDTSQVNPYHTYYDIGNFTPCLYVSNEYCFDTICKDITINIKPLIGVPNAFSPNNDGVNDVLYVEGESIKAINFIIFNRWGNIVFQTQDIQKGWDGTYNGKLQEVESYTYSLSVVMIDDSKQIFKGNISLMR